MLALPKTTEFNKRIPKQKFYENLPVTPVLKRAFVEQIRTIWWRNKIAAATVNLAPGEAVTEIEVLELRLNQPSLDEAVLRQIDREIPYHILFLLEHAGKYQAWIGYKEAASGSAAFQVRQYYHTGWMEPERLPIRMEGITVDAVYENFVRQVAGGQPCGPVVARPCRILWSGTSGGSSSRSRSRRWRTRSGRKSNSTGRWN